MSVNYVVAADWFYMKRLPAVKTIPLSRKLLLSPPLLHLTSQSHQLLLHQLLLLVLLLLPPHLPFSLPSFSLLSDSLASLLLPVLPLLLSLPLQSVFSHLREKVKTVLLIYTCVFFCVLNTKYSQL